MINIFDYLNDIEKNAIPNIAPDDENIVDTSDGGFVIGNDNLIGEAKVSYGKEINVGTITTAKLNDDSTVDLAMSNMLKAGIMSKEEYDSVVGDIKYVRSVLKDELKDEKYSLQSKNLKNSNNAISLEYYNDKKDKMILESKSMVELYNSYIIADFEKCCVQCDKMKDKAISNIFKPSTYHNLAGQVNQITDVIFGVYEENKNDMNELKKNLADSGMNFKLPELKYSKEEIRKKICIEFLDISIDPKIVREEIRVRLNYNKYMIELLKGILNHNTSVLGLSMTQAKRLSEDISSDNGNKKMIGIKTLKRIIKDKEDKFKKPNGIIDLTPIGAGVIYMTTEEVGDVAYSVTIDRLLQKSLIYDCIVIGHGDDEDGKWTIGKVHTSSGGPYTNVEDVLESCIKEGKKNIYLICCNPGHYRLSKNILDHKDVKIHISNNTLFAESENMDWSYDVTNITESRLYDMENNLINMCNENNIDYFDNVFLNESYDSIISDNQCGILNEAGIWSSALEAVKKLVGFIVSIFKKMIEMVKSIIDRINSKIKSIGGSGSTSSLSSSIKSTFISLEASIKEFDSKTEAELMRSGLATCDSITKEINKRMKIQTDIVNKLKEATEKNAQRSVKENADMTPEELEHFYSVLKGKIGTNGKTVAVSEDYEMMSRYESFVVLDDDDKEGFSFNPDFTTKNELQAIRKYVQLDEDYDKIAYIYILDVNSVLYKLAKIEVWESSKNDEVGYKLLEKYELPDSFVGNNSDDDIDFVDESGSHYITVDKNKNMALMPHSNPVFIITSYTDTIFGKVINRVTNSKYSHAAVSFDSSLSQMYSYGQSGKMSDSKLGGFSCESIQDYAKISDNSIVMVAVVFLKDKDFNKMKSYFDSYLMNSSRTTYSYSNLFNIISNREVPNNYTLSAVCSQFVDSLFKFINVDMTGKNSNLVTPQDIANISVSNPKIYKVYEGRAADYSKGRIDKIVNSIEKNSNKFLKESSVITETKEFPVQFNDEGDLLISMREKIDFKSEYSKSKKLRSSYKKYKNSEGLKYECCKLWYMNTILVKLIDNKKTSEEEKKVYVDMRSKILTEFSLCLHDVQEIDNSFNFNAYYSTTPFSSAIIKIKGSTIKFSLQLLKHMF